MALLVSREEVSAGGTFGDHFLKGHFCGVCGAHVHHHRHLREIAPAREEGLTPVSRADRLRLILSGELKIIPAEVEESWNVCCEKDCAHEGFTRDLSLMERYRRNPDAFKANGLARQQIERIQANQEGWREARKARKEETN